MVRLFLQKETEENEAFSAFEPHLCFLCCLLFDFSTSELKES